MYFEHTHTRARAHTRTHTYFHSNSSQPSNSSSTQPHVLFSLSLSPIRASNMDLVLRSTAEAWAAYHESYLWRKLTLPPPLFPSNTKLSAVRGGTTPHPC